MKKIILLIVLLQFIPSSLYYTHYSYISEEAIVSSEISTEAYAKFPLLNISDSPEEYTYYDLDKIIIETFTINLINVSDSEEVIFTFTRFENGEPYLSYYMNPTLEFSSTILLDWELEFVTVINETWTSIRYYVLIPHFELELKANIGSNQNITITMESTWVLVWNQREEPIPLVIKVYDTIIYCLIFEAAMLLFIGIISLRNRIKKRRMENVTHRIREIKY